MRRFIAILLAFLLVISSLPIYGPSDSVSAAAYDPETKIEGNATLDLRFWDDKKPDIGFYINAANRYVLETVKEPALGSTFGEWSVMDLLRGYYTGYDYLNYVPENYYEDYLERINNNILALNGDLDKSKSTEWSRLTLALSALGKDIRSVGEAGRYLKTKEAISDGDGGYKLASNSTSQGLGVVKLDGNNFTLDEAVAVSFDYFGSRLNRAQTTYGFLPPGSYTFNEDYTISTVAGEKFEFSFDEVYRNELIATHQISKVNEKEIIEVKQPYDFIEKLSKSYAFSHKQGINGPIWILIALHTGGYSLYNEKELNDRGVEVAIPTLTINKAKVKVKDINTEGRMIDFILEKEITSATGRVGGWALSGNNADPDITMMAVQGLAPYYLSEEAYKNAYKETIDPSTIDLSVTDIPTGTYYDVESASFKEKYINFKKAVERAVAVMAEDQKTNGGYASWGTTNSESIVQVIVGLTALGIDPLSDKVELPTIGKTVSFITDGSEQDGVTTNNMIDALISFWAMGSGSSSEVSGFKHVTQGYDGGGGSGTTVNAMATDQAIYGLIAYDRFLKNEKRLYDMTDMINGEYKTMKAKTHNATYKDGETVLEQEKNTFSPYEVVTIPAPPAKEGFKAFWNTKADGTGAYYKAGEKLSTPDHDITLYTQYTPVYDVKYELNGGTFVSENYEYYNPNDGTLTLPTGKDVTYDRHEFLGWYTTPDFSTVNVTELIDSTKPAVTLYAKWLSYAKLVEEAIAAIAALPTEEKLTVEHAQTIKEVTDLYEALPTDEKKNVTNVDVLNRAKDVLKVREVEQKIASLPEEITLEHEALVKEVEKLLKALTTKLQKEVKNVATLQAAKEKIAELLQEVADREVAEKVRTLIKALPTPITLNDVADVQGARTAYDALTAAQKKYVEEEIALLLEIEKNVQELVKAQTVEQMNTAIAKLPAVEQLTITDQENVLTVYALYNELSKEIQDKVEKNVLFTIVAKVIELQIEALPAKIEATHADVLAETEKLYKEVSEDIQKLVKNYETLQKKQQDLIDLPKIAKANDVMAKINELPATVTIKDASNVLEARKAYDTLKEDEKAFVTNVEKLKNAERIIEKTEAAIASVNAQIASLPTTVTLSHKSAVMKAYSEYQALSVTAKANITDASKLVAAYAKIGALENEQQQIVQALQQAINALPATMTLDYKAVVEDVRQKYNALTIQQKQLVTITKLIDAEQQIEKLIEEAKNNEPEVSKPEDKEPETTQPEDKEPETTKPEVTEQENSLEIIVPAENNEIQTTISPELIQSTTKPMINIGTKQGLSISLPREVFANFDVPVAVEVKISKVDAKPAIHVNIFVETDNNKPVAFNKGFKVSIPHSALVGPLSSVKENKLTQGVILAYEEETGYKAVPHIYKDGQYIVSLHEAQTLVYSTEVVTFNDIQKHGHLDEIEYLASRHVIQGYSDNTFRPSKAVTRGQFASLVSRALGLQTTNETVFTDIEKSSHEEAIKAVVAAGIMKGKTPETFAPNEPLTRQHAAVVMARVLTYMGVEIKSSTVTYTDATQIHKDYMESISVLNQLDIMTGRKDGSFGPKETLTRAQLAKILQRTLVIAEVM